MCTRDLTLVFRTDGDSGDKRLFHTPEPEKILPKMINFVDKDTTDCYGTSVFTPQTIEAIENVKRHITVGCISDIPPGGGTNRNERFHHHINSMINRSKIGSLLAYTLLTVLDDEPLDMIIIILRESFHIELSHLPQI